MISYIEKIIRKREIKNMAETNERNSISEKYKWKLEDIFKSDTDWEEAVSEVKSLAEKFAERKGKVCESADALLSSLRDMDNIGEKLLSVAVYACMRRDEDNTVTKYRAMSDRIGAIESEVSEICAFFEPELVAAGKDKTDEFISENEELSEYRQFFDNLFREAEHILDEKGEMLLAASSPMGENASDIFRAMNNADIKFGKIKVGDEEEELTHSRYAVFMESSDREVRKAAFDAMYRQYENFKNTFAAMYAGSVKSDFFYAKVRSFTSTIAMRLGDSNIAESVYDALLEDVNGGLDALSEYLALRKKILGVGELHMYDLYVPLTEETEENIPYEEACELVLKAVAPLGEQYVSDMRRAFSERWVDVYENRGKTPGAYSWGDNTKHPFVLMNYQGTIEDVFTLAHEMGHAMHSFYTNKTQPPIYRDYKIFVAEVASTVNENLLLEYLLRDAEGSRRAYLLGRKLEAIRTTFYRQTMFAEFEREAHRMYMEGGALTAEALSETYGEINRKYYGSVAVCDESISYEWARIPHFYTSFYVYQYATGFAAATKIKELVLNDVTAASKYMGFLASGSSDYPLELLKKTGVDLCDGSATASVIADMREATRELAAVLDK